MHINLDPTLLQVIVAVVLPAVVALVTARFSSSALKTFILATLAIATAVVTSLIDNDGVLLEAVVNDTIVNFGIAVVAYFGALKPLKVAGDDGVIQVNFPGGVGTPDYAKAA
jgi:hypothetical protein